MLDVFFFIGQMQALKKGMKGFDWGKLERLLIEEAYPLRVEVRAAKKLAYPGSTASRNIRNVRNKMFLIF